MTPRRSHFIFILLSAILLKQPVVGQPFKPLYLPDSLGGCADLDTLFYNPRMNELYILSNRSQALGSLDAQTGERKKPIHNFYQSDHYLTWSALAYNPNNNRLYLARNYSMGQYPNDLFALVYDCSTRMVIDTIFIRSQCQFPIGAISINTSTNQVFLTQCTLAFIVDGNTGAFIKQIRGRPFIHHPSRPITCLEKGPALGIYGQAIYSFDCITDSIVDSIILPPEWVFHSPALIAPESDLLFIPVDSGGTPWYDRIYIINCLTNQVLGMVQMPGGVDYLAYNPVNGKLYAGWEDYNTQNTYVIDAPTAQIADSLNAFGELYYNPNRNLLFIPTYRSPFVNVFDGATNRLVAQIPAPGWGGLMIPETDKLFMVDDGFNIGMIDCNQLELEKFFKMAFVNQGLVLNPVTNRLYVNDACRDSMSSILVVYDVATLEPIGILDYRHQVEPEEWFYDMASAPRVNKIYLTSGHYRGVYVINGNNDSVINLIPCDAGGHQLVYSERSNRMFVCPFTSDGYLYIIDCENDRILAHLWIDEGATDGYLNRYNELLYLTTGTNPSYLYIVDTAGTVLKHIRGLGNPLVFRNKDDIHQVYIAAHSDTCLYVFDPLLEKTIDTVPNIPVYNRNFAYYDSIDDRIYYPVYEQAQVQVLVIDCATNRIIDTIKTTAPGFKENFAIFGDIGFWNPLSNRLYYCGYIIDCRTNRLIAKIPVLVPTRTAWNYENNIVFVNDHWRAKVVAVYDNLIGTPEQCSGNHSFKPPLLHPSVGNRFIVQPVGNRTIKIVDACGRMVGKLAPNQSAFDAHNLAAGVYFATVISNNNQIEQVQSFTVVK